MSQYKNLEQADIEAAFEDLLVKNDQVTSLEVKQQLRNKGFWATQSVVGASLRDIANAKGCDYDFDGTFRTYYTPDIPINPDPDPDPVGISLPISSPSRAPVTNPVKNDWKATYPNGNTIYFNGKLRAGQAKSLFVKETGAYFLNVRVTRVQ